MPLVKTETVPTTIFRACYRGVLTLEQAQVNIGASGKVVELRPAKCCGDVIDGPLVDATEVLFEPV